MLSLNVRRTCLQCFVYSKLNKDKSNEQYHRHNQVRNKTIFSIRFYILPHIKITNRIPYRDPGLYYDPNTKTFCFKAYGLDNL